MQSEALLQASACLRDDEVHVWFLRYRRERGREPLRRVLAAYLGISADEVSIVEAAYGRPELDLAHRTRLNFNWSHSGDRAVIAVSHQLTPGIDLERVRPRPKALDIAQRYFHQDEYPTLAAMAKDERDEAFLALWTAKEAILKAIGRGLAFGLERLHIDIADGYPVLRWLDGESASDWQLHPLDIDNDHRAALAWRGCARNIRHWTLVDP